MADQKLTALTPTTTPFEDDVLYIVIDTGTTPIERKIKYSDLVEAKIVGTARQYTKGQGGTLVTLTSATNATPIDFADGNFFTYTAVENSTLSAPTNDQPFSCVIFFEQDATGGRTFAFNAAYDVFGDAIPTTALDKALIQITSDGAGELVVIIQARQ